MGIPNGFVKVSEFAKIIGVSSNRVHTRINQGKISSQLINRMKYVHAEDAKTQWTQTINPVDAAKNPSGLKKSKNVSKNTKKKSKKTKKDNELSKRRIVPAAPKVDSEGFMTVAEAERRDKVNKARLSELKYQEQAKELIKVDKVRKRAFELARKTRDAVMGVPTRFAHELAAETDPHALEIKLTKILQKTLETLIKDSEKHD